MTLSTASIQTSDAKTALIQGLVAIHGAGERGRIERGVAQVAACWRDDDGTTAELAQFCTERFVAEGSQLTRLLARLEGALEQIEGHLYEMRRTLRRHSDLAGDEFADIDDMLATFDPAPDLSEQMYRQKLGFVALLNFPRETLAAMLAHGATWNDESWARIRIAQTFTARLPKELADESRRVSHACQQWVAAFHIPVGTLVDSTGSRWFEQDRALLTHWIVREEIKGQYNNPTGVTRQRALAGVLARAIDGGIPKNVMDRTNTSDWNAAANTLGGAAVRDETMGLARYERWLEQFALARKYDGHYPEYPTAIARKFELAREMSESSVEALLVALLDHPVREELAAFLRKRLGRDLEPFDIYFDDIAESRPASELNAAVHAMFPDEKAFERALPQVLRGLGFSAADADFLGSRIRVEIAKGSGHAMRPYLTEYSAWLRTGRLKDELGWDGFDTAMHELGHNLEQLCSTFFAPRPSLRGVPNTACTEAFAFLYQSLGKRVLGIEPDGGSQRAFAIDTVQTMLAAAQIAGPSLLELYVWRWLYANPAASAAALRTEVLAIADRIWGRFYARDFGNDPSRLLAAYQHMIAHPLYLADYTLGHVMSHQIRSFMRDKDIAAETKRITSIGQVTPELWMQRAVGSGVSIDSLARDTREALTLLTR
ncbi:MAG: hypothetical protein EXS17_08460 [Phycisphaerales bacterium]|nr:hypothetical protein [Phycisphaerales bacterium]